jgi:hypothetical protein
MDRGEVIIHIDHDGDALAAQYRHGVGHPPVRQSLEYHYVRFDEDIADGVAFHDEAHLPLLSADHVDVMTGSVE